MCIPSKGQTMVLLRLAMNLGGSYGIKDFLLLAPQIPVLENMRYGCCSRGCPKVFV